MADKKVLIAGATGLVGYAAMKHFVDAYLRGVPIIGLRTSTPQPPPDSWWIIASAKQPSVAPSASM